MPKVRSSTTHIRRIADLTQDPQNANLGTARGREALAQSLREFGPGRAVLIVRHGNIIAGNKTVEEAKRLNIPLQVVKTDGDVLVAVQREDLDLITDPRAKRLAMPRPPKRRSPDGARISITREPFSPHLAHYRVREEEHRMTSSNPRQRGVFGLLLAAALFPATASAQPVVHSLEMYGTAGLGRWHFDESFPDHLEVGGGARLFLTRRSGIAGDLVMLRSYWSPNRYWSRPIAHVSFVHAWGPTTGIIRPYWLAGVSMGDVPGSFWHEPRMMVNGGLGARVFIDDRYFLAPEVRGPVFRASISGGIALGGE